MSSISKSKSINMLLSRIFKLKTLIPLGILIIGLFVRLELLNLAKGPVIYADEYSYSHNARYLIDHQKNQGASSYPLGYSLAILPAVKIGDSPLIEYKLILSTNIFFSIAAMLLFWKLVGNLTSNHLTKSISTILFFLYPPYSMYAGFSLSENLFVLLQMLFFYVFWKSLKKNRIKTSFLTIFQLSLITFLLFLTRENGIFNLLPILILIMQEKGLRQKIVKVSQLAFLILIFSLMYRYLVKSVLNIPALQRNDSINPVTIVKSLFSGSFYSKFVLVLSGQLFYASFSYLGMIFVPFIVFFKTYRYLWKANKNKFIFFISSALLLIVNLLFSSAFMTIFGDRGDHVIYGRYIEPYLLLFIVSSVSLFSSRITTLNNSLKKYGFMSLSLSLLALILSTKTHWIDLPLNSMNIISLYPFLTLWSKEYFYLVAILFLVIILIILNKSQRYIYKFSFIIAYFLFSSLVFTSIYYNQIHLNTTKRLQMTTDMPQEGEICYDENFFSVLQYFGYRYHLPNINFKRVTLGVDSIGECNTIVSGKKVDLPQYNLIGMENGANQAIYSKNDNELFSNISTKSPVLEYQLKNFSLTRTHLDPLHDMVLNFDLTNKSENMWVSVQTAGEIVNPVRMLIVWLDENDRVITENKCDFYGILKPEDTVRVKCKFVLPDKTSALKISLIEEGARNQSSMHKFPLNSKKNTKNKSKEQFRMISKKFGINTIAISTMISFLASY